MLKPLLFGVALVLILLGFTCVARRQVHSAAATGRPLDHMGDGLKCQKCGKGGAKAGKGYWYECPHCHEHFRMKWNEERGEVEVW